MHALIHDLPESQCPHNYYDLDIVHEKWEAVAFSKQLKNHFIISVNRRVEEQVKR
jgi:hypothetical protein